MLSFHVPIPDVAHQLCRALLAQEYWYRGQLVSNANVLFLRLNEVLWHRFFIDAGVVFWRTVETPDPPAGDDDDTYPQTDVAAAHRAHR
jgi:hypothetical protein